MRFRSNDSEYDVLADIRELLYIIASTGQDASNHWRELMLEKFETSRMEKEA